MPISPRSDTLHGTKGSIPRASIGVNNITNHERSKSIDSRLFAALSADSGPIVVLATAGDAIGIQSIIKTSSAMLSDEAIGITIIHAPDCCGLRSLC